MEARALQTSITLVLEQMDPELSRAHRELYPERIAEHIPFSLTLHYTCACRAASSARLGKQKPRLAGAFRSG
jgi:hypothetical protein